MCTCARTARFRKGRSPRTAESTGGRGAPKPVTANAAPPMHPKTLLAIALLLLAQALPAAPRRTLRTAAKHPAATQHTTPRTTPHDAHTSAGQAPAAKRTLRLTVGGAGEAAFSHEFRLPAPPNDTAHRSGGRNRFDIPHASLTLGCDFGRGWSFGSEAVFVHGGKRSDGGKESDGTLVLEQLWIRKSFGSACALSIGELVVPVGSTNKYHAPTDFFTVYRPEGENTLLPSTWHETGIAVQGRAGAWEYEAMLLPGLDSDRFGSGGWISGGAHSPRLAKPGAALAGAFRIDNSSVRGLRIGLSGYAGNSFSTSLGGKKSPQYGNVRGTVLIGALDLRYDDRNFVVRSHFDYGHLTDSGRISAYNASRDTGTGADTAPLGAVGSDAIAAGIEVGYDLFSLAPRLHARGEKFHLFVRYEYYDSMYDTAADVVRDLRCSRRRFVAGCDYKPVRNIVIKAQYAHGLLRAPRDKAPSLSLGIAYSGIFVQ